MPFVCKLRNVWSIFIMFEIPVKEAEHSKWGARLRTAMRMAYCLQHMHELGPLVAP